MLRTLLLTIRFLEQVNDNAFAWRFSVLLLADSFVYRFGVSLMMDWLSLSLSLSLVINPLGFQVA